MKMEDVPLVRKPSNDEDKEESINSDEPSIFKFCPSCGFNNENLFKFCPGCGNSLIS